jgi:hypothetical protein
LGLRGGRSLGVLVGRSLKIGYRVEANPEMTSGQENALAEQYLDIGEFSQEASTATGAVRGGQGLLTGAT